MCYKEYRQVAQYRTQGLASAAGVLGREGGREGGRRGYQQLGSVIGASSLLRCTCVCVCDVEHCVGGVDEPLANPDWDVCLYASHCHDYHSCPTNMGWQLHT